MYNSNSQQEKETFLTYLKEINRDIYEGKNNVQNEIKREKHLIYLKEDLSKLVNKPINILDFYNNKKFQFSRRSRLGKKVYDIFREEEKIALPFYFPELEGLILDDSDL